MTNWKGDLTPRGLRSGRDSSWPPGAKIIVVALVIVTLAWLGLRLYIERQARLDAEQKRVVAEQALAQQKARSAIDLETRQRAIDDNNRQLQEDRIIAATGIYGDGATSSPRNGSVPPAPRRSVQEEYELASKIMESTSREARRARETDNTVRTRYGVFKDQLTFNYWWLNGYENSCHEYGTGSINYRNCRAMLKEKVMHECRERVLEFERLPSAQRDEAKPIKDAQCYAANNYRIVE